MEKAFDQAVSIAIIQGMINKARRNCGVDHSGVNFTPKIYSTTIKLWKTAT